MRVRRLAALMALALIAGTATVAPAFDEDSHGRRRGRHFRADTRPGHDWQRHDQRHDDWQGQKRVLRQDAGPHTYWGTTRPYWGTMQPYWGSSAPHGSVQNRE